MLIHFISYEVVWNDGMGFKIIDDNYEEIRAFILIFKVKNFFW
jgi:hypothetical protein